MTGLSGLVAELTLQIKSIFLLKWDQVEFRHESFVWWAGALLVSALVSKIIFKLIFGREKSFFYHSGHQIKKGYKIGIFSRIIQRIPLVFLLVAIFSLMFALADPFIVVGTQTELIKSRERIDLFDTSSSMLVSVSNPEDNPESVVSFLRRMHLRLIAKRQNKKDRVALFNFDDSPVLISDFTTSSRSYLFIVNSAPTQTIFQGGGGTNLGKALGGVINHFDLKGAGTQSKRAILIMTDGDSNDNPIPILKELKNKKIVPYLIFVRLNSSIPLNPNQLELFQAVRNAGGYYFTISGKEEEIERISNEIDKLESVQTEIRRFSEEQNIYQRFLVFSFLFLCLAIVSRTLFWFWNRIL